jgi:hypothetical protein
MTTTDNVQPLRALTDAEALAAYRGGPAASGVQLAKSWGWSPQRVSKRLKAWRRDGLIGGDNSPGLLPAPVSELIEAPTETQVTATENRIIATASPQFHRRAISGAIGAAAIALAAFGLTANATYVAKFGQPGFSAIMLAGLGVALEILALGLPPAAALLARGGDRRGARIAWALWLPAVTLVLISSCGFSSRYIADSVFARHQVTDQAAARRADLDQLKAQRAAIRELRPVATIDAAILQAQAAAVAAWRRSDGCTNVTRSDTAAACAPIQVLREARADAVARDALDGQIRDLSGVIAAAPSIALADPAASTGATIIAWASHGAFVPTPDDIGAVRILILTMAAAWAGPLLSLAVRLWGTA